MPFHEHHRRIHSRCCHLFLVFSLATRKSAQEEEEEFKIHNLHLPGQGDSAFISYICQFDRASGLTTIDPIHLTKPLGLAQRGQHV
jgi:hypothetical protein